MSSRKPISVPTNTLALYEMAPAPLHKVLAALGQERRRVPRFNLKLPITLTRKGARELSENGQTRNLSSKGVLFRAETNLRVGEVIEYVVTLSGRSRKKGLR